MSLYPIAVVVGSLRKASFNRASPSTRRRARDVRLRTDEPERIDYVAGRTRTTA